MTTAAPGEAAIPDSHLDLFIRPVCGTLTTIGADGGPQSSLVWVDLDDGCVRFNTTLDREKGRNLLSNPRASLLLVDPENTARYVQIRGDVELLAHGAMEHLDALTRKYTQHPRYYGFVYPQDRRARETRVIGRIRARRVTVDAIHA